MEKEDFFAAAALALGPPPVNRRGIAYGTLVGEKVAPRPQPVSPWVKQQFTFKLAHLWVQVNPNPGVALEAASYDLGKYEKLYEEYDAWYQRQERVRLAAEAM